MFARGQLLAVVALVGASWLLLLLLGAWGLLVVGVVCACGREGRGVSWGFASIWTGVVRGDGCDRDKGLFTSTRWTPGGARIFFSLQLGCVCGVVIDVGARVPACSAGGVGIIGVEARLLGQAGAAAGVGWRGA